MRSCPAVSEGCRRLGPLEHKIAFDPSPISHCSSKNSAAALSVELLLDTHALIWWLTGDAVLGLTASGQSRTRRTVLPPVRRPPWWRRPSIASGNCQALRYWRAIFVSIIAAQGLPNSPRGSACTDRWGDDHRT